MKIVYNIIMMVIYYKVDDTLNNNLLKLFYKYVCIILKHI